MSDLIDQIEEIRRKNNVLWMEILRIALETNPKNTKRVIKDITDNDRKISALLEKLARS